MPGLFLSRIEVGGATYTVEVDLGGAPKTYTVPVGDYYAQSADPAEHFVNLVSAGINAYHTVTVIIGTDYRVTFQEAQGAPLRLDFSADLAAQLGLDTLAVSLAASGSYTAPHQLRDVWLPGRDVSNLNSYRGSPGRPIPDTRFVVSPNGSHKRTTGPTRYELALSFQYLAAAKVWTKAEAFGNTSFESFMARLLLKRNPSVRWYLVSTDATYTQELAWADERFEPVESLRNVQAWWNLDTKWVPWTPS